MRGFGERKGGERQIDGAQPGSRKADQKADRAGEQRRKRHSDDERYTEPDLQQRCAVNANAEERDMRERELSGPAEQQVEPDRQHGEHHQKIAEIEKVLRQDERQYEARGEQ